MRSKSRMGRAYRVIYDKLCGRHPYQRPWHFQFLSVFYLHKRLKQIFSEVEGRVLDVGCGKKPYRNWMKKSVEYVGLDVSAESVADVLVEADEIWPVENESFDCIMSIEVLEHVEFLGHTISEIDRVLKPKGVAILSFPFLYNEHGGAFDFLRFTKHYARNLFPGYEVQSIETLGGVGSTLGQLFLNWIEDISNRNFFLRLLKGLLLPIWIFLAFVVNILALLMDCVDNTNAYYSNVLLIVRKAANDASQAGATLETGV